MTVALYRLGRWCATHRTRTLLAWLATAVVLIASSSVFGNELSGSFEVPGLDSQDAYDLLEQEFPNASGITAQVVVQSPAGTTLNDTAQANAVNTLVAALGGADSIVSVNPPQAGQTISTDGTIGLIALAFDPALEPTPSLITELAQAGDSAIASFGEETLRVEYGGEIYSVAEEPETGVGELAGIIAAVIILLVAFGSLTAMGMPLGIAVFGLSIGIAGIMGLVAIPLDVPSWAPQLAGMIGLGVGIDYALFVVTRYREGLHDGLTIVEAAGRANATAGLAVVFAGGTVVIAILGLAIAGLPFLTAAGISVSIIVLMMVLASITVLPALMSWAGYRVIPRKQRKTVRHSAAQAARAALDSGSDLKLTPQVSKAWERWGNHVSRRSLWYLIGGAIVLLALTAPVLKLELGFPDLGNQPAEDTERQAYDLLSEAFGPGFNGPFLIAIETEALSGGAGEISRLAAAIRSDAGIENVGEPVFSPNGRAATLQAFPTTSPQSSETIDTLDRLRGEVFTQVLSNSDAAHIGGATATFSDLGERVQARLPWFIGGVILLSFILLLLVFRSIFVPIKAAILNLLSIGAAYGVLVMVFQWGWGLSLIGVPEPVPIVSFIPMMMFAVLFGLSMDYEVFLLSRVREEYLHSNDNNTSVIIGISTTARVITSAALIMITVFGGFVTNPEPVLKMMGLGLATAIFVDAFFVRVVLVPAWMHLMGDRNWWFPKSLRWLPRIDLEGETVLPPREYIDTDLLEPSGVGVGINGPDAALEAEEVPVD